MAYYGLRKRLETFRRRDSTIGTELTGSFSSALRGNVKGGEASDSFFTGRGIAWGGGGSWTEGARFSISLVRGPGKRVGSRLLLASDCASSGSCGSESSSS